jgi:hypothetical protein
MALSTFNASNNWAIDTFIEHYSLTYDELVKADRYRTLKLKSNKTLAEITEMNSLLSELRNKIIIEDDFNKLQEAIANMQTYLKTNVADYLTQKQNEWSNTINQFSTQGNFDNTKTYQKWNVVFYNYESYVSKQNNNLNHTPNDDANDLWWGKLSARGQRGEAGMNLVYTGDYNNATTYTTSQAVRYNNNIYYCISTTTGNLPTNTTYWSLFLNPTNILTISSGIPTTHANGNIWIRPL